MIISVQAQDFSIEETINRLTSNCRHVGAVVTFSGLVRDLSSTDNLKTLFIEHYPGMTERVLSSIATEASEKWEVEDVAIIHRIGKLMPSDNIVLVVVISAHRKQGFHACEYIMDFLKTSAPFWKKETSKSGESWVSSRCEDIQAAKTWI